MTRKALNYDLDDRLLQKQYPIKNRKIINKHKIKEYLFLFIASPLIYSLINSILSCLFCLIRT